jgi:MATE family multidrug resistance protein
VTAGPPPPGAGLLGSARRILPLAWPVLVGQLAVLAFGTVDTLLVARFSAVDLAALAIGAAAYITVFIGLMGVVLAVSPIVGQMFGGHQLEEAGRQLQQAAWLALGLSVPGCALLLAPQPFLDLAQATPEVAEKVRAYLRGIAFALPPALLFTAFRGFNTAVSRPKTVMLMQLGALTMKLPMSALLVFGLALPTPWGEWRVPALGAAGGGLATAIVMWIQALLAWQVLQRDPFYAPFQVQGRGLGRPDAASLRHLLRLGVPLGLSVLIEVTGFTFMAFFIARMGTTAVAGHQLAANLISILFMVPLALGNATSTLVSQRIGAHDPRDAAQLAWQGMKIAVLMAAAMGGSVYLARENVLRIYTHDEVIVATALPLLAWLAVFHVADAAQTMASFILRAYRIVTIPLAIYTVAIWGVGLGGGFVLAFDTIGDIPPALQGASGFWSAAALGLVVAAAGLSTFLAWVMRQRSRADDGTSPAPSTR